MIKLLLATNNQGKLAELRSLLSGLELELLSPQDLGLELKVKERGMNYLENAVLKAAIFADAAQMWTLADDSGLEVDALDGAPGLYSARYSPLPDASDKDRRLFLIENLKEFPRPWKATFHSVIALVGPEGSPIITRGACSGDIIPEDRGHGGFGYDKIFRLEANGLTMAELTPEQKNQVSHRAQAVSQLVPILETLFANNFYPVE
ncbi:MAG TPA: RdgB/HAM1 family non-canonical purine NTP pyrophosphatase [Chloroflexi bacterium]|nr:MAG: non-canonical purine NTP pyrophosphatase, RdgB/HAM1 family [Chloroflexota bacterium]HDD55357.1 RdgB/HAM1 family non-canonical purine NTP pyrophosphatase [Chloroflexota bacterium]